MSYNTTHTQAHMTEHKIKRGDFVTIKPEWLDPGEDDSMKYVVLEEQGDNRILVQALGTSHCPDVRLRCGLGELRRKRTAAKGLGSMSRMSDDFEE